MCPNYGPPPSFYWPAKCSDQLKRIYYKYYCLPCPSLKKTCIVVCMCVKNSFLRIDVLENKTLSRNPPGINFKN